MSTSIIVPVYGPQHFLDACVLALEANTEDYELVLVDNATGYPFPDYAVSVRNEVNQGFAVACNQGAKVATGDVLVMLNVDTEVRAGWLPPLLEALEQPEVVVAGPKLLYPDGTIQCAGIDCSVTGGENRRYDSPAGYVPGVTGACMAVWTWAFWAVGAFDEGYWNGYDDVDFMLSVRQAGWRIWYEPSSVVIHHESATGGERWTKAHENVARLQSKWAGKVVP